MRAKTSLKGLFWPLKVDKKGCVQYFDTTPRSDRPFELWDVSFDREQYRLQIHPIQMPKIWGERNAIGQKPPKSQELPPSEMAVFWTFLEWCKRSQKSFFTRHRSRKDTSFDVKLSNVKYSGAKLAWTILWATPPSDHWSYPLKAYNFFRNHKSDFRFVFSSRNWVR